MSSSLPTPDQFELPNTDEKYRPNLTKEQIKEMLEKAERLQDLIDSDKENSDKSKQQDSSKNTPKNQEKDSSEDESLENYLPQNERPTLINVDNMKKNLDQSDSARFYREGNYDEYQKYIAQFAKEIAQAKKLIAEIIKQNKLDSIRRGSEQTKQKMTKLPIQGGASIDLKRHVALEQKLKSENPNISRKDLERFRTQYKYRKEELIEEIETPQSNFGILIDGSGSMCGAPFDNALAISCILYEAARSFKEINIYIYMMGSPTPLTIAKPEDKTKTVAKRLESVRKGQGGCNDYLIPAVRRFLLDISEDMAKRPYIKSGFTHIFSITDGGNNDYNSRSANGEYRVNNILETLLDENEQITYDSFFIDEGWINYTKPLIQKMKSKGSTQMDYVDNIVNAEDIPQAITNMLKKRMRHSQIKSPMTNAAKQKIITATLKSIKYH